MLFYKKSSPSPQNTLCPTGRRSLPGSRKCFWVPLSLTSQENAACTGVLSYLLAVTPEDFGTLGSLGAWNSWSFWKPGSCPSCPESSWGRTWARGLRSLFISGKYTACLSMTQWVGHREMGMRLRWERQTKESPRGKMALIYRETAWWAFLGTEQLLFFHGISPSYMVEHTSFCLEWSQWQYWILNQTPLLDSSISLTKIFSLFQPEPCSARG